MQVDSGIATSPGVSSYSGGETRPSSSMTSADVAAHERCIAPSDGFEHGIPHYQPVNYQTMIRFMAGRGR